MSERRWFRRVQGTSVVAYCLPLLLLMAGSAVGRAQQSPQTTAPQSEEGPAAEPVRAEPQSPLTEAKATQARAAQLFRDNQFAEAAELLRIAYRQDPRPILLFNAGQAYRKADRAVEARALYEQFLAAAPGHPLAPETRGYIKDMEALSAMQLRVKKISLALEEQVAATQLSERQAAATLEQERQRSLQIHQALLQTQEQLARDRKKLAARRRWIVGLSLGIPAVVAAVIGGAAGAFLSSRASTDGGTVNIER